jgi:hypothetical protein
MVGSAALDHEVFFHLVDELVTLLLFYVFAYLFLTQYFT